MAIVVDQHGNVIVDPLGRPVVSNPVTPGANDVLCYIFWFPSQGAEEADTVVGPLKTLEVLVFGDLTVNSVTPFSGFWCMFTQFGGGINQSLLTPNLMLVIDQSLLRTSQSAIVTSVIPTEHIGIIVNAFGSYITDGIPQ